MWAKELEAILAGAGKTDHTAQVLPLQRQTRA
jgi:hypothetical protein